jgi:tRNA(Ile)-lysidine synthetase-like protein
MNGAARANLRPLRRRGPAAAFDGHLTSPKSSWHSWPPTIIGAARATSLTVRAERFERLETDEMNAPARDGRRGAPGRFARRLLDEWKRLSLPSAGEAVVVAASGGADSTALVLALAELVRSKRLAVSLKVAHLDHGLRGRAGEEDARWVARLANDLGLETEIGRAAVGRRARASRDNLEQAARRERYEFLARAARAAGSPVVLTAHTLDDQAETFLLALLRGTGAGGLGAMRPARPLDAEEPTVTLARPLLRWARWASRGGPT